MDTSILQSDYIVDVMEMKGEGGYDFDKVANKRFFATISRPNFGKITFLSPVKLEDLENWNNFVFINHKMVVVYPNEESRPPIGIGLNCSAEVTLENVWSAEEDQVLQGQKKKYFEKRLKEICERQGAEFVSYHNERGTLKFKVPHFSKYSIDLDDEDDDETEVDGNQNVVANKPISATTQSSAQQNNRVGGIRLDEHKKRQGYDQEKQLPLLQTLNQVHSSSSREASNDNSGSRGKLTVNHHKRLLPSFLLDGRCGAGDSSFNDESNKICLNPEPIDSDLIDALLDEPMFTSTPREELINNVQDGSVSSTITDNFKVPSVRPSSIMSGTTQPLTSAYSPILKSSGSLKSKLLQTVFVAEGIEENQQSTREIIKIQSATKWSKTNGEFSGHVSSKVAKRPAGSPNSNTKLVVPKETSLHPSPLIANHGEVNFFSVGRPDSEDLFSSLRPMENTVGCKMFGAPRVGFSGNGLIVTVKNKITPYGRFHGLSEISKFETYFEKQEPFPLAGAYRETLKEELIIVQKQKGQTQFQQYADVLMGQMSKTNAPKTRSFLKSEFIVWQLCDILWPDEVNNHSVAKLDEGFELEQRARLSDWLIKNGSLLFGTRYKDRDDTVFGLLKKGRMEEACDKAVSEGNHWLAVLLTADAVEFLMSKKFRQFFPINTMDIMNLSAGSPLQLKELDAEFISNMGSCDWLQYFALYLWYHRKNSVCQTFSVHQAICNYERLLRKICSDEEYPLPKNEGSTVSDLCVRLLKLYSCQEYPVNKLLGPMVWTNDILDYKLSWLLMMNLEVLGYTSSSDVFSNICTSFAGQLEQIGMFEWAVFVKKFKLPIDTENMLLVENAQNVLNAQILMLLEKHIVNGHENLMAEKFLVEELGIDKSTIYTIKAEKALAADRQDQVIGYYLQAGEYQKAFNVFKEHVDLYGVDMVTVTSKQGHRNANLNNMLVHLKMMYPFRKRIAGWEVHGNLILYYFKLSQEKMAMLPTAFTRNAIGIDNKNKCKESAVLGFINAVLKYSPQNERQFAFLLELTITAQKAIEILLTNKQVDKSTKDTIKNKLFRFLNVSVPQEYFSGFRDFISNLMFEDDFITV